MKQEGTVDFQQSSSNITNQFNVVHTQNQQLDYSLPNVLSQNQQFSQQPVNLNNFPVANAPTTSLFPVNCPQPCSKNNDVKGFGNLFDIAGNSFVSRTASNMQNSYSSSKFNLIAPASTSASQLVNQHPKDHESVLLANQQRQTSIKRSYHRIVPSTEDIEFNSKIGIPKHETSNYWCNIFYYEMNQRVGDVYKTTQRHVIVDGLCATSDSTRFCLGMLANVNRNPVSARARRQIGKGCRIRQEGENNISDIFVENLSESPIFVQSPLYAASIGDDLSTVYRLPQDSQMKIFDRNTFEELVKKAKTEGYFSIHSIQPMCNIRISFVKGWGAEYNRPTITTTPCWVEVQFLAALQILSNALDSVNIPKREISNE